MTAATELIEFVADLRVFLRSNKLDFNMLQLTVMRHC